MTSETLSTTDVERKVASRVGHWTRLNSVFTSSKNCRARLNIKPLLYQAFPRSTGRTDRDRTCDLRFWRPMLYQLSYCPVRGSARVPEFTWFRGGVCACGPTCSTCATPAAWSSTSCSARPHNSGACTLYTPDARSLSSPNSSRRSWSLGAGLNCRPHPYQGCALPLSYQGL